MLRIDTAVNGQRSCSNHPNTTQTSMKANPSWDLGCNRVRKDISIRCRPREEILQSRRGYTECLAAGWDNSFRAKTMGTATLEFPSDLQRVARLSA